VEPVASVHSLADTCWGGESQPQVSLPAAA